MEPESSVFKAQYSALTHGAGMVDFRNRTQIELTGADRAKYLHNLCTNAVRDLPAGKGCETFILNVKGHIVGHVFVFVCPDSIVLETVPNQAEKLLAHLERYLIREDVQLADCSQTWGEVYLAGPQAKPILVSLGLHPPETRLAHTACQIAGRQIWLRNFDLVGPDAFAIACPTEYMPQVQAALETAGAMPCNADVFNALRIETGTPQYGRDINEENLPQEIDRDRLAISFTKGCYLGQETVARIDALGHVNRLLRGVKFAPQAAIPTVGTALQTVASDNVSTAPKSVGRITSACWSPQLHAPLALALVHRESAAIGTKLQSQFGGAEVVPAPSGKGLSPKN
ncbi:MAG TPA: glycine cleavage T C-terminal barrel domain-containing protein [Pirellulales bacterium]